MKPDVELEQYLSEISSLNILPDAIYPIIGSYLTISEEDKIKFYSSSRWRFFKNKMSDNYCSGVRVSGFLIQCALTIPILLLEGISILFLSCYDGLDNHEFHATEAFFSSLKPLGIMLGSVLSIIPAILISLIDTYQRPKGVEVYPLIEKMDSMDNARLNKIICSIVLKYDNANEIETLNFPGYLYDKDKNSEELCEALKQDNLSNTEKALKIKEFM